MQPQNLRLRLARVNEARDVAFCVFAVEVGGHAIAESGCCANNANHLVVCAHSAAERLVCGRVHATLRFDRVVVDDRVLEDNAKLFVVALGARNERLCGVSSGATS